MAEETMLETTETTATAETTAEATTAAETTTQETTQTTETAETADDWRKSMAGDNEDALKLLGRYTTPQDAARALVEQRQLLSKRDEGMIKLPGENATDEERAAFAKAMGIPESPDKYERYKPEGEGAIELAEADKAFVDSAIAELHKAGGITASPAVIKTFEGLYYKAMEERASQMAAAAVTKMHENENILKQSWGSDYKVNMTYANSALQAYAASGDKAELLELQLADGTKLGAHAGFIKMMANAGRATTEDPAFLATLTGESMSGDALEAEIKKIEGMRQTDPAGYQRNFDRYKTLIAKREQLSSRAA